MAFVTLSSLRCCLYDSVLRRTLEILDSGKEDIGWHLYGHGILAIVKKINFLVGEWLGFVILFFCKYQHDSLISHNYLFSYCLHER